MVLFDLWGIVAVSKQQDMFVQWVEDLFTQGHIDRERYNEILVAVARGDYEEIFNKDGGVY